MAGRNAYQSFANSLIAPCITTLLKYLNRCLLDLTHSGFGALRQCRCHFKKNPYLPRVLALSDDGMKISQTVVWTKGNRFVGFVRDKLSLSSIYTEVSGNTLNRPAAEAVVVLGTSPFSGFCIPLRIVGLPQNYKSSHLVSVYTESFQELTQMGIEVCSRVMDACSLNRKAKATFARVRMHSGDSEIEENVDWPEVAKGLGCEISSEIIERMKDPMNGAWFENPWSFGKAVANLKDPLHLLKRARNVLYANPVKLVSGSGRIVQRVWDDIVQEVRLLERCHPIHPNSEHRVL